MLIMWEYLDILLMQKLWGNYNEAGTALQWVMCRETVLHPHQDSHHRSHLVVLGTQVQEHLSQELFSMPCPKVCDIKHHNWSNSSKIANFREHNLKYVNQYLSSVNLLAKNQWG